MRLLKALCNCEVRQIWGVRAHQILQNVAFPSKNTSGQVSKPAVAYLVMYRPADSNNRIRNYIPLFLATGFAGGLGTQMVCARPSKLSEVVVSSNSVPRKNSKFNIGNGRLPQE